MVSGEPFPGRTEPAVGALAFREPGGGERLFPAAGAVLAHADDLACLEREHFVGASPSS